MSHTDTLTARPTVQAILTTKTAAAILLTDGTVIHSRPTQFADPFAVAAAKGIDHTEEARGRVPWVQTTAKHLSTYPEHQPAPAPTPVEFFDVGNGYIYCAECVEEARADESGDVHRLTPLNRHRFTDPEKFPAELFCDWCGEESPAARDRLSLNPF